MMLNKRLINLSGKSSNYITGTGLAKWGGLAANIAILFLFGRLLDMVLAKELISIMLYIPIFLSLIAIRFVCNYYTVIFSGKAASEAKNVLPSKLYEKIVALQGMMESKISTMSILQAANEGIESLENYFGRYLPQFFYAMIAPVTLFIVVTFISLKTAAVFILCVPLIPISIIAFMRIAKRVMKKYWGAYIDLGGTFLENLRGLTTLKLFQVEDHAHEEMDWEAENFRKVTMRLLTMQLNSVTLMDIIAYGGSAAGIIVALFELQAQTISPGEFLFIVLISSEFFIPLRLLGSFFHVAMTSVMAANQIFEVLDMEEPMQGTVELDVFQSLRLQNIDFAYADKQFLSGINLMVNKGEFVSLVGESGSGKSTIAALLMRLLTQQSGEILINDLPIQNYTYASLLENVTLISTNSPVFNATIEENLRVAKHDAKSEELEGVLSQVNLLGNIAAFPDGIRTNVGEQGNQLSGGQRQRLAIARALLSDCEFLIFDEATSNIDSESEELIWNLISQLKRKKTILTISHRLANVKTSDCIYVLENGNIRESGTHAKLINDEELYANLVAQQHELEMIRG